jgi:hypothetical protein
MTFTYCDDLISDFHKDVYGYRPRESFWNEWETLTPTQKQTIWDEYDRVSELQVIETKAQEERDVAKFEDRVQDVINIGAGNRKTALKWIADSETFYHGQDVEHFVWQQGILFTGYGKQLIKDLLEVVKYEEYA